MAGLFVPWLIGGGSGDSAVEGPIQVLLATGMAAFWGAGVGALQAWVLKRQIPARGWWKWMVAMGAWFATMALTGRLLPAPVPGTELIWFMGILAEMVIFWAVPGVVLARMLGRRLAART
jgi:hypothetical protein